MFSCENCAKWTRERRRHYSDGTEQSYYTAPEGKGRCEVLGIDTTRDFGCNKFSLTDGPGQIVIDRIEGAPWEHWTLIPCPDCNGVGSANDRACRRCSGTAKVRRYDDGYVADATWDHPLEKERKKAQQDAERCRAFEGTTLATINRNMATEGEPAT
jgi:hypothetical protein